jgi:RimJ/RimL family protein N-acetyltransferase
MSFVEPIVLQGKHVVIEPLEESHLGGLQAACADGELWKLWYTSVPEPEQMAENIQFRLDQRRNGSMMPFVVRRIEDNRVVGATTYCNIQSAHRRLEIGYTWYANSAQRTAVNTEVKYLLLTHAFEALDCIAVEFRTHWMNHQSRTAIERLGAKLDGVLRAHQIGREGELRDTCVYSIVAMEWPAVRAHLQHTLARR